MCIHTYTRSHSYSRKAQLQTDWTCTKYSRKLPLHSNLPMKSEIMNVVGGQYGNEEDEKERCLSIILGQFFQSLNCLSSLFCVLLVFVSVCLYVCVFMCPFFFVSV